MSGEEFGEGFSSLDGLRREVGVFDEDDAELGFADEGPGEARRLQVVAQGGEEWVVDGDLFAGGFGEFFGEAAAGRLGGGEDGKLQAVQAGQSGWRNQTGRIFLEINRSDKCRPMRPQPVAAAVAR